MITAFTTARPLPELQELAEMLRLRCTAATVDDSDAASEAVELLRSWQSQLAHGRKPSDLWLAKHGERLRALVRAALPELFNPAPQVTDDPGALEGPELVSCVLKLFVGSSLNPPERAEAKGRKKRAA